MAAGRRSERAGERESKRSNEAESPTPLKQQKAAVYVAFTDFTHEEVMAKKTLFAQCVSSGFNYSCFFFFTFSFLFLILFCFISIVAEVIKNYFAVFMLLQH